MKTVVALLALTLAPHFQADRSGPVSKPASIVHGMTISCETFGREWGSDRFPVALEALGAIGVNWVAIHPYASIREDGSVEARRIDPAHPPEWITRPIREAHARGQSILVIPHIAYWGSPWRWRGDIEFEDAECLARFFATYTQFLVDVVACARGADAFSIGNELEKLVEHDAEWRALILAVRKATDAKLTYAANWSGYDAVPFWDALDAIGVDAYFPLCSSDDPTEEQLRAGWAENLAGLERVSKRTGKPVVFTELGYNCSLDAARTPWTFREEHGADRARAEALQARCLRVALDEMRSRSDWLRGAFIWKWFLGNGNRENFLAKTPAMIAVIRETWGMHGK